MSNKFNNTDIGNRIKEERTNRSWSKTKLGEQCYVTRQTISKWEGGSINFDWNNVSRLCELFDCDVGYLLGEYDTPHYVDKGIYEELGLSNSAIQFFRTIARIYEYDGVTLDENLSDEEQSQELAELFQGHLERIKEYDGYGSCTSGTKENQRSIVTNQGIDFDKDTSQRPPVNNFLTVLSAFLSHPDFLNYLLPSLVAYHHFKEVTTLQKNDDSPQKNFQPEQQEYWLMHDCIHNFENLIRALYTTPTQSYLEYPKKAAKKKEDING